MFCGATTPLHDLDIHSTVTDHSYMLVIVPEPIIQLGQEVSAIWPLIVILVGAMTIIYKRLTIVVRKTITNTIADSVNQSIEPLRKEFQTNSGKTVKDDLVAIRGAMRDAETQRLEQYGKLDAKIDNLSESFQASGARLLALTSSSKSAYYEIDENANLTYVNDAYLMLFDLSFKEAMSGAWRTRVHPDDLSSLERAVDHAMKTRSEWTHTFRVIRRDGSIVTTTVNAFPIMEGSDFVGFTGALRWW